MTRPNVRPDATGPGIFRFLLGDAVLRCSENIHDDVKYAQSAQQLRALATPIITVHEAKWKLLRDGRTEAGILKEPGFWVDSDGLPLKVGMRIPKEAYIGMVGAIVQILYDAGIFWRADTPRDESGDFLSQAVERSRLARELAEGETV